MDLMEIKILNTAIERTLNKEMAELGITYTQATVIGFLRKSSDKEICQKDVETNLGLTHPTVSSILSRLEEKGLIMTTPFSNDRRYKKIFLTDKSMDMAEAIQRKIEKISEDAFYGINEDRIEELSTLIKQIVRNIS
jgi:DNA-binding MarR family transcriptional regulator